MDPEISAPKVPQWRKACLPCTHAKRRCDKGLPSCRRCSEKDMSCQYASTRPYTRRAVRSSKAAAEGGNGNSRNSLTEQTPWATLTSTAGLGVSQDAVLDIDVDVDVDIDAEPFELVNNIFSTHTNDSMLLNLPRLDLDGSHSTSKNQPPLPPSSWFLGLDTWAICHMDAKAHDNNSDVHVSDFKRFTQDIKKWLVQWTRENHCPFIHRQLYTEMPTVPSCIQDAFAAAALYAAKNDDNGEIVWKIIETSADKLLRQRQQRVDAVSFASGFGDMAAPGLVEQLAYTQALFVYQFIRLFDGDIRQRAQAERHMPTLTKWVSELWQAASVDACLQISCGFTGLFSEGLRAAVPPTDVHVASTCSASTSTSNTPRTTTNTSKDDSSTKLWRDWLLAESIRRIWLVGSYLQAVYTAIRDSEADCVGGIMLTSRRSLWDAPSAATWTRLVQRQDPLFVLCHETDCLIPSIPPVEVDALCLSVMGLVWGASKLEFWLAGLESQGQNQGPDQSQGLLMAAGGP